MKIDTYFPLKIGKCQCEGQSLLFSLVYGGVEVLIIIRALSFNENEDIEAHILEGNRIFF